MGSVDFVGIIMAFGAGVQVTAQNAAQASSAAGVRRNRERQRPVPEIHGPGPA